LETADYGYGLDSGSIIVSALARKLIYDPRLITSYLGGNVD